MVKQFLSIASLKTTSNCWVPTTAKIATFRYFSSQQPFLQSCGVKSDQINLDAREKGLTTEAAAQHCEALFEPTVHSSEEIFTAGPVNKA